VAFGVPAARGSTTATSADTSIAVSPTPSALPVDNYAIAIVCKDNVATSSGETTEVTSFADDKSNTWNLLHEYTFAGSSPGAGAGVCTSVWLSKLTTQIETTDDITAGYASVASKVISVATFTVDSGNTCEIEGTPQISASSVSAPSTTISGLTDTEHLYFVACGLETAAAVGAITNYTALLNAVADTGTNSTSIRGLLRYRILSGTGDTATGASMGADKSWIHFALKEVPGVTTTYRFNGPRVIGRMR
jgi:hypothetical protein